MKLKRVVVSITSAAYFFAAAQSPHIATMLQEGLFAKTLVKTPQGYTPIETFKEGVVLTGHDLEHNYVNQIVTGITKKKVSHYFKITIGNAVIYAAPQQKFYQPDSFDWIAAQDITTTTVLLKDRTDRCTIDAVERVEQEAELFCLTVEGHNFCITPYDIVVHNFAPALVVPFATVTPEAITWKQADQ